MADLTIRALHNEDIRECAAVHLEAFPGFFLSQLGPRFLTEFYRGFVTDPKAITAVALDESGQVAGVVVGTLQPSGFFARLLRRRWWAFAFASVAEVVRRPSIVPRLVRALTYRGQVPIETSGALLSSICVNPAHAGSGVGTRLIRDFERQIDAAGVDGYLLTDRVDNDGANAFYVRNGWQLSGSFETPEGRAMNCYTYSRGA